MGLLGGKKHNYILIRTDTVEVGKAYIKEKTGLMELKTTSKRPELYYGGGRCRFYIFFEHLPHSVKFDFSLFKEFKDQLRRECLRIEETSEFIMNHTFTKGFLDIDKGQFFVLCLLMFGGVIGGGGMGIIAGLLLSLLF